MSADALPRRPMLGAVLDALTVPGPGDPLPSFWCATGLPTTTVDLPSSDWLQLRAAVLTLSAEGARIVVPRLDGRGRRADYDMRYAWTTTDPAEAYELLQARGLIPTDYRPRFVCDACGGGGVVACGLARLPCLRCALPCAECGGSGRVGEVVCGCVGSLREDAVALGHRPHPPTVAALASWASLGFAAGDDDADDAHVTIARAEDLARELNDGAEVWWQVAPRTTLAPMGVTWPPAIEALWGGGLDVLRGHTRTVLYVPPLGLVTP